MVKHFVDNGANPLVCRKSDGYNLFKLASVHQRDTPTWLEIINICKAGKVTPNKFTEGLAYYLDNSRAIIDLDIVEAFVNNGANPLVCRKSDGRNLYGIAKYDAWNNDQLKKLTNLVDLYTKCIKSYQSIPISKTTIGEFDEKLTRFSCFLNNLNRQNDSSDSDGYHRSAHAAGIKLSSNLASFRSQYEVGKITMNQFRILCAQEVTRALETDLAQEPAVVRALLSFLNIILGLTIVIPIATKITTGRWGLFTCSKTEGGVYLQEIADILRGLAEGNNSTASVVGGVSLL